ncbi:MAG: GDP-mannose 4,6-dehydratase, partial [Hymenobacteraceae bacterium]|nr:GDP-mannose 4,6-dehydratase [Hymenobacteraceae bacterium]MDX5396751.1 GDP-mannose 4,6-dehydratase [Hymenobacteraceae bacterium]MDX5442441.1 GDP-mannose 4,6-dehydratase [Hymenobacteraceae bacterium]MDX5512813.1 GDP-mannose 4,6-dehydratase [Hymenobacteraceae bacterium]
PKQDPNGAYAAVIPLFIDAVLKGNSPKINGDGGQTRDFTFVENCVQANIKAALVDNPDAVNQVYNIAVGDRTSLNDLFYILKEEAGADINPIYGPDRAGDIRDSLADISKAKNLLGYDPQVRIREGLKRTLQWFKENQEFIYNKQTV